MPRLKTKPSPFSALLKRRPAAPVGWRAAAPWWLPCRTEGGLPVEIANMALFLATEEASYVNGQAIAVCGGLSSSHPVVPGKLA